MTMSRKARAAEFIDEGYSINVIGRHISVTDAMKQYALEKLSKVEKFNLRIIDVTVVMDVQKVEQRVDIKLKLDHVQIRSHAATEDMYASIEQAIDKLQNQIRRYRDRIRDHQAKNVSTVDMNVNVMRLPPPEAELADLNGEIEEENERQLYKSFKPHEIVTKERMALKTLTQEEAVMKLELSGHVFLLYRAEEDQKLKLIYRKKSNDLGIVEIES